MNAKRILVVDDEPGIRSVFSMLLQRAGFTTQLASDGKHALEVLEKHAAFDAVATGFVMPEMKGCMLARIVSNRYPGLPVMLFGVTTPCYEDLVSIPICDLGLCAARRAFRVS